MSSSESPRELGWSFSEFERDPRDLAANGFRPVWTIEEGYPGPMPDDIAEWIDPQGDNRAIRLVGPISLPNKKASASSRPSTAEDKNIKS